MKLYQRAPRKATSFGKNGVTAWHRFGKGGKNLGKEISEGECSVGGTSRLTMFEIKLRFLRDLVASSVSTRMAAQGRKLEAKRTTNNKH